MIPFKLYQLLIGLWIKKLKEEDQLRARLIAMIFSSDETNVELGWELAKTFEISLAPEWEQLMDNLNQNNTSYLLYDKMKRVRQFPMGVLAHLTNLQLRNPVVVSPFIRYAKALQYLIIQPLKSNRNYQANTAHLSGNLKQLPCELGELTQLRFLQIIKMPLEGLPDTLAKLHRLEHLIILNTKLSKLPNNLGQLKNLKFLILNNNCLDRLPASLGTLSKLQIVKLEGNPLKLENIPAVLWDKTKTSPVLVKALNEFFQEEKNRESH